MAVVDMTIPLSIGEMIGSLMHSIIDAQAQSARTTVEFILNVGTMEGFEENEGPHNLRYLKFNYQKLDENGINADFTLNLPLLGVVDIPVINIKTAKISFTYDITQTTESLEETNSNIVTDTSGKGETTFASAAKRFPIRRAAKLKGRIQKKTKQNTTETGGLQVEIELEKSSLTSGIDQIIDMLELAATNSATGETNP